MTRAGLWPVRITPAALVRPPRARPAPAPSARPGHLGRQPVRV